MGIERAGTRLTETEEIIQLLGPVRDGQALRRPLGWETQNLLTIARLMTASALAREESRGVHFRTDHPDTDPKWDGRHIVAQRSSPKLKLEVR